jgi:hypothetical protein
MTPPRFPPPWSVEGPNPKLGRQCFIVHDATYVYFEEEPRRRAAAKLLTRDEARRHPQLFEKFVREYEAASAAKEQDIH